MLMSIDCKAVTSLQVSLRFDDNRIKETTIAVGDVIDAHYHHNGCRKHCNGKVVSISCCGNNSKEWYLLVDNSKDFDSDISRINAMSILDVEVIYRAEDVSNIKTPSGCGRIPYLRLYKGRLQFSIDGKVWDFVVIDSDNIIEKPKEDNNQNGTEPPVVDNPNNTDEEPSTDGTEDVTSPVEDGGEVDVL